MSDKIQVLDLNSIWIQLYNLAMKIKGENFLPEIIIGISRGGLTVARFLSDILEIKEIATIAVGFYKGINETMDKPSLLQEINFNIEKKSILLVDDVSDTGESMKFTLSYLLRFNPKVIKTATIHYKTHSKYKPDFYVNETSDWIVYPWEYVEFSRIFNKNNLEKGFESSAIYKKLESLGIPLEVINLLEKTENKKKKR